MSRPAAHCLRTTSVTASRTSLSKSALSYGCARSCAFSKGTRASGRARLPTWVVRMRSVLRFICCLQWIPASAGMTNAVWPYDRSPVTGHRSRLSGIAAHLRLVHFDSQPNTRRHVDVPAGETVRRLEDVVGEVLAGEGHAPIHGGERSGEMEDRRGGDAGFGKLGGEV